MQKGRRIPWAAILKISTFWIELYLILRARRLEGRYRLHIQDGKLRQRQTEHNQAGSSTLHVPMQELLIMMEKTYTVALDREAHSLQYFMSDMIVSPDSLVCITS